MDGRANDVRGQAARPLFRDNASYWDATQPGAGVQVPNTGTGIRVLTQRGTSMDVRISARDQAGPRRSGTA